MKASALYGKLYICLCGQFFLALYISYFKPSPLNKFVTSSEILSLLQFIFLVISLLIGFFFVINMLNSLLSQNLKLSIILFPPTNKGAFIALRLLGDFLPSVTAVFFFFFFLDTYSLQSRAFSLYSLQMTKIDSKILNTCPADKPSGPRHSSIFLAKIILAFLETMVWWIFFLHLWLPVLFMLYFILCNT